MPTYKTTDGLDYLLPGIGHTENGQITTEEVVEHPRFKLVDGPAPVPEVEPVAEPVVEQPVAEPVPELTNPTEIN